MDIPTIGFLVICGLFVLLVIRNYAVSKLDVREHDIRSYIDQSIVENREDYHALNNSQTFRLDAIENEEDVIGEYPMPAMYIGNRAIIAWVDFSKSNIDDQVGEQIKICGVWRKKEDVIFYDKFLLGSKKKEIEKRLKGKV